MRTIHKFPCLTIPKMKMQEILNGCRPSAHFGIELYSVRPGLLKSDTKAWKERS